MAEAPGLDATASTRRPVRRPEPLLCSPFSCSSLLHPSVQMLPAWMTSNNIYRGTKGLVTDGQAEL
jgi:hypothetical protein